MRRGDLKSYNKRNQREHPAHNRLVLCFLLQCQSTDVVHPGRKKLQASCWGAQKVSLHDGREWDITAKTSFYYGPVLITLPSKKSELQRSIFVHFCVTDTQQRKEQILCSLHKFRVVAKKAKKKWKIKWKGKKEIAINQIRIGGEQQKKCCVCPLLDCIAEPHQKNRFRFSACFRYSDIIFLIFNCLRHKWQTRVGEEMHKRSLYA